VSKTAEDGGATKTDTTMSGTVEIVSDAESRVAPVLYRCPWSAIMSVARTSVKD